MKTLLFIFLMFTLTATYAQLEKGTKLLGLQGNLLVNDIYSTKFIYSNDEKDHGFSLVPSFGYALQRNWLVGAQATVGFEQTKNILFYSDGSAYEQKDSYTDLGFAPFTRLYLDITKNKKWKLFGVAALEIVKGSMKTSYAEAPGLYFNPVHTLPSPSTHSYGASITGSIGGGLGYFGRRFSIDASMSTTALRIGFYKVIPGHKK